MRALSDKGRFLSRRGESVTWGARSLAGGPDAETNWPYVTYDDTTILAYFEPISTRNTDLPAGFITENRLKIYTASVIGHRDRITRGGIIYDVETDPDKIDAIRGASYYTAILVKVV